MRIALQARGVDEVVVVPSPRAICTTAACDGSGACVHPAGNADTQPGNDKLSLVGAFTLPAEAPLGGLSPLRAIVTLGGPAVAAQGVCGESTFVAADCSFNAAGNQILCKR